MKASFAWNEGNWTWHDLWFGEIFGFTLLILLENAFMKLSLPLWYESIVSSPMEDNPSWICPKKFFPNMKSSPCFRRETLRLWCMQVDVHNTLINSCAMFEENNMNFMNPHDNEITERNHAKVQKKLVFWK